MESQKFKVIPRVDECINYLCVDFFESHGVTPEQHWLDACENAIELALQKAFRECVKEMPC